MTTTPAPTHEENLATIAKILQEANPLAIVDFRREVSMPFIQSIDDIAVDVDVAITVCPHSAVINLIVSSNGILSYYHDRESPVVYYSHSLFYKLAPKADGIPLPFEITLEDYTTAASVLLTTLPLLKFNRYYGKFYSTEPPQHALVAPIWAELKDCPTIKFWHEECCVCHEDTTTRTGCKHSLCYACWDKLPEIYVEEDYDGMTRVCPICRGVLL